jgi:hypothetical protein
MSLNNLYYYRRKAPLQQPPTVEVDACIYGGTSIGVIAAIELKRRGYRVALVEFGKHLGGLSAGGLGMTDIGNKEAIGGLARQFYRDLGAHYGTPECWYFEPHAAEHLFQRYVTENEITVHYEERLQAVRKAENYISEIIMESGVCFRAKIFIDATYEGDLMAGAGISFHVGRESSATYGELYNGVNFSHRNHNFKCFVDPYKAAGNPSSGLLEGISPDTLGIYGEADHRVQAFNFRVCLTDDDANRRPFPCPTGYDPERFQLLARYLKAGIWDVLGLTVRMPHGKTDTNNEGAFSSDHIGANYRWPEGDYQIRETIFQDHLRYNLGLYYFLANDLAVPRKIRDDVNRWGLPKDEFISTGGWPHQLYIREGRRMISDYVMTEHNALGRECVVYSVGLAAYGIDSHNCQRVVWSGRVINEGNVQIPVTSPYPVAYRSICPREKECANLLVPWSLSASHIAFGSIRMEPVGMVLGQSSAVAAALALNGSLPVQRIDVKELQRQLRETGQVIDQLPQHPFIPMKPIIRL